MTILNSHPVRITSVGYQNQRLRSRSSKSRIILWYPRSRTKSTILAATPTQSPVQFKFLLRRMICYISLQPLPCRCCPSRSPGALHKHLRGNLARGVKNQWPLPSSNSRTQCVKLKLKRIGQHSKLNANGWTPSSINRRSRWPRLRYKKG